MFKTYTPIEYLCIDIANCYGLDKELFETRIQWVKDNVDCLEDFIEEADDKPLYIKAVLALRETMLGKPIGHLVALDATCSGIQIMSAITGCVKGADATGLVTSKRADAYTDVTGAMNDRLTELGKGNIKVPRPDVKRAVMTSGYGSTKVPKEVFGDGYMLQVFYHGAYKIAPSAFQLMQDLLGTWQPMALSHNWIMPDNFHVNVKVMESKEVRIEVDELNHTTFTTYVKINQGSKTGLSNVANIIHSIDAYLLRTVIRRASYNKAKINEAVGFYTLELLSRSRGKPVIPSIVDEELNNMLTIYEYSGMLDVSIIDLINDDNIAKVPTAMLVKLVALMHKMQELGSSPVLTVHDAFRAHPNHCNAVRYWYKEIMAELAESNILQFIVSQVVGQQVQYQKKSMNLANLIRQSNYAIC